MNQKFKKYFPPLIGILAVFAVWYIVCRAGILSSYVLPSPGRVFQSFCKMLQSGELFRDLRISFLRVGKGFVIAFILAFAFGMLRAMIPTSAGYYEYLVQFFRNVPPLSMIPLLILWCGIGETTKTVIIVLASFFPMYLNIVKGFTGCDRKLLEVGTMFGYTDRQKFFRIMLPYAMADILVGMRIGLGYSWRAISVHRSGAHDPVCPADVPDRQGHRRHLRHRHRRLSDRPDLRSSHQHLSERSR